jgi:hypothetical protein
MSLDTEPLVFDVLGPDGEPVQFERAHSIPLRVTENELTWLFAVVKKHDPKGQMESIHEQLLAQLTRWSSL